MSRERHREARKELDAALARAEGILFVCSGNVVRSAFAELYARHLGLRLPARSAATRFRNRALFPETERALLARGVPRELLGPFRPRHWDRLAPAERAACEDGRLLVLGMTREHLAAVRPVRGHLLGPLSDGPDEIPDPVLEGAPFGPTFERVASSVEALAARLDDPAPSRPEARR